MRPINKWLARRIRKALAAGTSPDAIALSLNLPPEQVALYVEKPKATPKKKRAATPQSVDEALGAK